MACFVLYRGLECGVPFFSTHTSLFNGVIYLNLILNFKSQVLLYVCCALLYEWLWNIYRKRQKFIRKGKQYDAVIRSFVIWLLVNMDFLYNVPSPWFELLTTTTLYPWMKRPPTSRIDTLYTFLLFTLILLSIRTIVSYVSSFY